MLSIYHDVFKTLRLRFKDNLNYYLISINIVHYLQDLEHIGPLVSEEKVIFGLNARAVSQLTLAKIRKIYSRVDSKSIAKQVMHD